MGRKKIKMEFIENLGARIKTFKRRKVSLTKKIEELTTLCDIGACMIIYDPAQNRSFVWPDDRPDQVRRLIESYRCKIGAVKSCGVSDYLAEKKIMKVERNPISNEGLDSMKEEQLRELGVSLRNKSEMIRSRIHMMKMREMQDRHQLEMMRMLNSNSADYYHMNNLDYQQQFLMNPTIVPTATDFGSYMNIPSSIVPLPQMNDVYYNDGDQNYCHDQNQNQIQNYCYNDDGHDDDEMKNNMMLWDGLVSTMEFSAEDQKFLDSLSWDV